VNQPLTFTAALAEGSNAVYTWEMGDGVLRSGQAVTHAYAASGVYTAVLTATNLLGSVATSAAVTVEQPITGLNLLGSPITHINQSFTLTAALVEGNNATFAWDMGDGTRYSSQSITHIYISPGVYIIQVSAANAVSQLSTSKFVDISEYKLYFPAITQSE
jgi:PKD repeat protein